MLGFAPFYHATIRKCVIGFGKLFSDIRIERRNKNGVVEQLIEVPISLGSREKWLTRLEENPTLRKKVLYTIPRIGFEVLGIQYDSSRKLNSLTQVCSKNGDVGLEMNLKKAYVPVPYNLEFALYIVTKTQEDAYQILEQILPFFKPQYNLQIVLSEELGIIQNVPVNLNGVAFSDSYEGAFEQRREIIHTLTFTLKTEFLGPIQGNEDILKNLILHTDVRIDPQQGEIGVKLTSDVVSDTPPFVEGQYQIIDEIFDIPRPIE